MIQPTILYDFPIDISPLSKQKRDDPSLVERFEIYVAGMEIANGFSELNDPAEQERRFLAQIAEGGEESPKRLDVDYIQALCYGLPPTAGEGIGIDRLDHAADRFQVHSRRHFISLIASGDSVASGTSRISIASTSRESQRESVTSRAFHAL